MVFRLESSVQRLLCPSHISLNTQHNPRHTRNGWSETDGGGQIHTMTHTQNLQKLLRGAAFENPLSQEGVRTGV